MYIIFFFLLRSDEIVMPAEHTGLVRENYLWKVSKSEREIFRFSKIQVFLGRNNVRSWLNG